MTTALTDFAKNSLSGHAQTLLDTGTLNIYEGGLPDDTIPGTLIVSFTGLSISNSAGILTVTSGVATVLANATAIDAFTLVDSSSNIWIKGKNQQYTVADGNQDAANNRLNITDHQIVQNQELLLSGTVPTFNLTYDANYPVRAVPFDANSVELYNYRGGQQLTFAASSGGNLLLDVLPVAISDNTGTGLVKIDQTGLALTQNQDLSFQSFTIAAPSVLQ